MNYRNIADLSKTVRDNIFKIPPDVDLVVGIPRSGMLAANIIALNLNLKFCDTETFLNGTKIAHGRTRKARNPEITHATHARHILIVDDSVDTGESIQIIKSRLSAISSSTKITYCSVYVTPSSLGKVDIYFEALKKPRLFEWNLMHRSFLNQCCLDIDGVLCLDPTPHQNDDGPAYRNFLLTATPLIIPSYPVGHLVTSRLEKYREETEVWLRKQGVVYETLHMLDLPNAEIRRQLGCHASFKAEVFQSLHETKLFIESDAAQAKKISKLAGKSVLSFSTQEMHNPSFSASVIREETQRFMHRAVGKISRWAKRIVIDV
jgi:uncharacterized HAD superfamily protein/hypoxanthine phosphoribosyltransferase